MFRRPVVVAGPRHPAATMATGMLVGAAVAGRRAEKQQMQQQQQQQYNAQLAQANAEASAAKQEAEAARREASAATTAVAAAAVTTAVPVQQGYEPQTYAQPSYTVAPPQAPQEVGRQMLSEALDGGAGAQDLVALKKQLSVVQVMCDQALVLYRQSMELMKKAGRTNVTGAVMDAGFRRSGAMDAAFDAKRDAETKAAVQPAEKASAMLAEGFKKIPNELRTRYPQEMSRVGDVPLAKLKVGNFGKDLLVGAAFGQFGQNMNDIGMARKIRENEEDIARCMACVEEQKQLMAIVQARLDQDIAHAKAAAPKPVAMPVPPPAAYASVPAPITLQPMLQLISPHIVDEYNPAIQQHQIISVPQGSMVKLVRGSLETGLGAPYQDYIEVEYNGRVGKISRLIARPASAGVPPAYGVPPPIS